MEDTQAVNWEAEEEEGTESPSDALGSSPEPLGRLHIFSSAHGPEKGQGVVMLQHQYRLLLLWGGSWKVVRNLCIYFINLHLKIFFLLIFSNFLKTCFY